MGGSRFALVGSRRDAQGKFSPDGAIAWIGSLDKDLADLKPLLFDAGGPGAPSMSACCSFSLGVTRFLADGSLVVVPGVQPGIYHFDAQGKLLQTVDTVALGINTDCAGIGKERVGMDYNPTPRSTLKEPARQKRRSRDIKDSRDEQGRQRNERLSAKSGVLLSLSSLQSLMSLLVLAQKAGARPGPCRSRLTGSR
jgi:hypothetical protein